MTGILVGRFLVLGILAWVAVIALGLGTGFGLLSWRRRWTLAGVLAGLGTFGLFVFEHGALVALVASRHASALGLTAVLFMGCGLAMGYGTLFLGNRAPRPQVTSGSVEERLWLLDAVDRVQPQRLDWGLTVALLLPGLALAGIGWLWFDSPVPVVLGLASLAGPLFAALGLCLRAHDARRLTEEIEALDSGAASGALPQRVRG